MGWSPRWGVCADATAARTWVEDGATSQEHAAALLKNRLYRRWGIKTAREYARIKIDGLRLVGGNPDFTNAPGHLSLIHISEPTRPRLISYAVFCLKKK